MNKTYIVAGVVAVVVVGAAFFINNNKKSADLAAQESEEAIMEIEGTMESGGDAAMGEKTKDEVVMEKEKAMMQAAAGTYGAYAPEKLALAKDGKVILFFRASWCPTCRGLDADIRANLSKIPADITILDVNYDQAGALKQKYGVTYQHTFVQVDVAGGQIAKWTGSPTLAALLAEIK